MAILREDHELFKILNLRREDIKKQFLHWVGRRKREPKLKQTTRTTSHNSVSSCCLETTASVARGTENFYVVHTRPDSANVRIKIGQNLGNSVLIKIAKFGHFGIRHLTWNSRVLVQPFAYTYNRTPDCPYLTLIPIRTGFGLFGGNS